MGQLYWISEYVEVLLAFGFVVYIWPLVVFERHLQGKSRTYRFSFCVTVSVMLINTGVLLLGLAHLLYPVITTVVFYGVFLVQLYRNHGPNTQWFQDTRKAVTGTMSRRNFASRYFAELRRYARERRTAWWKGMKGHRLEYLLLIALLIYGTIYFSYSTLQSHSFGSGDEFVHHQWIYGLVEGKPFVKGIYPEAMHCVIYLVSTAFGIRLYSVILFFAGIYSHLFLIAAYLFMKEVFHWPYTGLLVLTAFLIFDQLQLNAIVSMSRFAWTLPMEFAFYTPFLAGLYLKRFLQKVLRGDRVLIHWLHPREWKNLFRSEELLIFMMSIAVSVAVHFYATIFVFFFCLAVALVYLSQIFKKGSFAPLAVSVILAFAMAIAPMGAALAMGYPMQGSIGWALGVIMNSGAKAEESTEEAPPEDTAEETVEETQPEGSAVVEEQAGGESGAPAEPGTGEIVTPEVSEKPSVSLADKLSAVWSKTLARLTGIVDKIKFVLERMYYDGYLGIYPGIRGQVIAAATAGIFVVTAIMHVLLRLIAWIVRLVRRRRGKRSADEPQDGEGKKKHAARGYGRDFCDGYLIVTLISAMLILLYIPGSLGLPSLMERYRICSMSQMFSAMVCILLVDPIFTLFELFAPRLLLQMLSWGLCAALCAFVWENDMFHGFLFNYMMRYPAATDITEQIVRSYPKQMFTIISTTEELYQIIESGYHEELLVFDQRYTDPNYTIPTPYVFLFIEKHPFRYEQFHFPVGPEWLGSNKYSEMFAVYGSSSGADSIHGEISEEDAERSIKFGRKLSDAATDLEGRIILESKAYKWYKTFEQKYPNEGRIFYEDDDFLCYYFVQNVNSLYSLGVLSRDAK